MKKRYMIIMALIAFTLALPMVLQAGKGDKVIGAANAKELRDGAKVVLEGYIKEHLRGDIYLFQDDTGKIDLEIDEDEWGKRNMDPEELVRVYGEVDIEDNLYKKVEVRKIKGVEDLNKLLGKIEVRYDDDKYDDDKHDDDKYDDDKHDDDKHDDDKHDDDKHDRD